MKLNSLPAHIRRRLEHSQLPETWSLGGAALAVGLMAGVGVWIFKQLFNWMHVAAFDVLGSELGRLGAWSILLIPVLGGLLVGMIRHYLIGHEQYSGVPGVMEAVALGGGRLPYQLLPAKTVASALSIGVGASVGPEDPSVQIGAHLASMTGRWLHLSDERLRTLVAAGAAAGIAAAFNAPIAGAFFALEIVLGEISGSATGVVVLASVASAIFTQAVSGRQPAFDVPSYPFHSITELPFYLVLGLLAGPVAALYTRTIYVAKDSFARLHLPPWFETATAGLIVGITGLFLPQIFGVGYDTIDRIFAGQQYAIWLLIALLFAKLLMTSVSIGGGFQGGLFAPSLFLGATLGAAFGQFAALGFPQLQIAPQSFAMVGMAAVLAGAVHAPLTAVILLFEMTNDYHIILPLALAVLLSMITSQYLQPDSIYTLALARKGIRLQRGRDVEVLEGITVADVMRPETVFLHADDSMSSAVNTFMRTRRHGLTVVNKNGDLVGILTVGDLEQARVENLDLSTPIGAACTRDLLVAYPEETIGQALRRMSGRDVGRLPVVERGNPQHLMGILRRNDVIRAYDIALSRRATVRHHAQQARLKAATGSQRVDIREMVVEPGSPCAHQTISQIPWPRDSMIVTLRRGRKVMIPHGDTRLEPGDVLVAVAEDSAEDALGRLCRHEDEPAGIDTPIKDAVGPQDR